MKLVGRRHGRTYRVHGRVDSRFVTMRFIGEMELRQELTDQLRAVFSSVARMVAGRNQLKLARSCAGPLTRFARRSIPFFCLGPGRPR
jgi:hypothetical protein